MVPKEVPETFSDLHILIIAIYLMVLSKQHLIGNGCIDRIGFPKMFGDYDYLSPF